MLLIDLSTGLQKNDAMILDVLMDLSKPVSLVLTKADKVKPKYVYSSA